MFSPGSIESRSDVHPGQTLTEVADSMPAFRVGDPGSNPGRGTSKLLTSAVLGLNLQRFRNHLGNPVYTPKAAPLFTPWREPVRLR